VRFWKVIYNLSYARKRHLKRYLNRPHFKIARNSLMGREMRLLAEKGDVSTSVVRDYVEREGFFSFAFVRHPFYRYTGVLVNIKVHNDMT